MTENKQNRILLDSDPAYIRKTGGVTVQRIPARWKKRRDMKNFFNADLEIRLIGEGAERVIEIRKAPKEENQHE